jgi:hypothetical protein
MSHQAANKERPRLIPNLGPFDLIASMGLFIINGIALNN